MIEFLIALLVFVLIAVVLWLVRARSGLRSPAAITISPMMP